MILMNNEQHFFPTCQVRVVRFYVSTGPPPSSPPSPAPPPPRRHPPPHCPSVMRFLWIQCDVPDLNRDPVSSVWRAGPQPRSCEFSVACRTSTAIL